MHDRVTEQRTDKATICSPECLGNYAKGNYNCCYYTCMFQNGRSTWQCAGRWGGKLATVDQCAYLVVGGEVN